MFSSFLPRLVKVSWVRRNGDQLHLITFVESIYSSDSRYSLRFRPPNDWQLHIQYANERDEGQFECQINTSPTLVFIVYLIVVGEFVIEKNRRSFKSIEGDDEASDVDFSINFYSSLDVV